MLFTSIFSVSYNDFKKFISPLLAKPKGTLGLHSVRLSDRLSVCPSVSPQY